jgi:hypothetical protein
MALVSHHLDPIPQETRVRQRQPVVIAVVLALAVVLGAVVAVQWWRDRDRTDLERALAVAPHEAERLSWTDWAGVRSELGARLSTGSSTSRLTSFLDRGYDADLTSTSALLASAEVLQAKYGFSPATVDWELFSQSTRGAVVLLHLPDGTDFNGLGDRLEELGYTRPADETGVWDGGPEVTTRIGADITPELQYLAIDADAGLVLASDESGYLGRAVDDARGGEGAPPELRDIAAVSGDPLSAAVYDGDYTCSRLAMSQADASDQAQADELLAAAGKVNPVTAFSMSAQPGGHVRLVLSFENDEQARTNADTRAALARGPAPGQGGSYADRFRVASVTADGSDVTLDLVPREGAFVVSDLSTGPLLLATC